MSELPESALPSPPRGELAEYERALRAMPSYELKAEYLIRIGSGWDSLPRPRLESAIAALIQARAARQ